MKLYLPPGAHLPRIRAVLEEICHALEKALAPVRRYRPVPDEVENALRMAVGTHALAALDAALAVHIVSGTESAGTIATDCRTVFECLVKMRWMRKDARRARSYLASEPFERYALANARVKKSNRWPDIVGNCKTSIAANPWLLDLPNATKGARKRPDFDAIAKALRMPSLEDMSKAIGQDDDAYLVDSDVPSLTPHTSVLYVKNFVKARNADDTFILSTSMDPRMLDGYVARTATRTGEVLKEVLDLWPDGAIMFEADSAAERLAEIVTALKGYWV
jgi:hypothetical protein